MTKPSEGKKQKNAKKVEQSILIKLKEDKIASHYTDSLNDLTTFNEKLKENHVQWTRCGNLIQLTHASGVSVSFEYNDHQDIAYYNYMLLKLFNKLKE